MGVINISRYSRLLLYVSLFFRILGEWQIMKWEEKREKYLKLTNMEKNIETSLNSSNLVVKPNSFLAGYRYKFILNAYYEGSAAKTTVGFEREVSALPKGGTCYVRFENL